MADPAAVFPAAGLQIPYSYSPVETKLNPPIQLPGTGELWAKVGQTAMEASKQIQESALNPAVRAQMKYAIDNYQRAQEIIDYHRKLGDKGFLLGRATTQGAEELAPAESGQAFAPLFQPKIPPPPGKEPPPAPEHAPGTGGESQEKTNGQGSTQGSTSPYGGLEEKNTAPSQPKVDPEHPPASITLNTQVPSQGGSTATLSASTGSGGQLNIGQAQSPDVAAQSAAAYRLQYAAQHPQGAPAGMFLNPATGSYEPLQTQQPPAQAVQPGGQQQGGSIWGPQRPTPIAPPPAPTTAQPQTNQPGNMLFQGSQPLSQTGSAIQQVAQQPGVALADWQAQNAHPVMASSDALKWAQNFDTGAQRATYLPHGGPNAEPAYAFHMKGGGINTVPISQIVKNGGGPLIAGQNTSAALSTSDALTNQQPPGQAPGMTLGATGQLPPGMQLGQQPPPGQMQPVQGQQPPPPAPGMTLNAGIPPQDTQTEGMTLGPAPAAGAGGAASFGQAPVPPSTSYDPTLYRQIMREAMANPQNLTAQAAPQAGTRSTDTPIRPEVTPLTDQERAIATPENIAAARTNARVNPNQPSNATENDGSGGDPPMGDMGPWHLYRDDRNKTNELYAIRPGLSTLFKQQRYYLGSDGWHEYDLPNSNMRLNLEAEYGGGKGGVGGARMPNGDYFPIFNHDTIANISVPAMAQWLKLAGQYHNTNGEPNAPVQQRLQTESEVSRSIQRLIDMSELAKKFGITPDQYNKGELEFNKHAGAYEGMVPPGGWGKEALSMLDLNPLTWLARGGKIAHMFQAGSEAMQAGGRTYDPLLAAMDEEVRRLKSQMIQVPGVQDILPERPKEKDIPLRVSGGFGAASGELDTRIPLSTEQQSVYNEVNRLFQGGQQGTLSQEDTIAGLKQLQSRFNHEYQRTYADAANHNYRLNPENVYDNNRLNHNQPLQDQDDIFRDKGGKIQNPYRSWPPPSANPSPTPALPQISRWDTKELDKLGVKKGDYYMGPDKNRYQRQ